MGMSASLADTIFVWSFVEVDCGKAESFEWFVSPRTDLYSTVRQRIEGYLSLVSNGYGEYLNGAEFPDLKEQLKDDEVSVFLKAADVPMDCDPDEKFEAYNNFSGLVAVIRHRMQANTLESLRSAAELFNWTVDFGLNGCDGAAASIAIGTLPQLAFSLIQRITWVTNPHPFLPPADTHVQALRLVLQLLESETHTLFWTQNEFAVRSLVELANHYLNVDGF